MRLKPVDNRSFSRATNAVLHRLKESDVGHGERRVWTYDEMLAFCGGDKMLLRRACRCLRQTGWLEMRPGLKSGGWYFRLTEEGRATSLLSLLDGGQAVLDFGESSRATVVH